MVSYDLYLPLIEYREQLLKELNGEGAWKAFWNLAYWRKRDVDSEWQKNEIKMVRLEIKDLEAQLFKIQSERDKPNTEVDGW